MSGSTSHSISDPSEQLFTLFGSHYTLLSEIERVVDDTLKHRELDLVCAQTRRYISAAIDYLDSAGFLLEHGKYIPACSLMRIVSEIGVRLLWSSVQDNGHQRMMQYWIEEREKWGSEVDKARDSLGINGIKPNTGMVSQSSALTTGVKAAPTSLFDLMDQAYKKCGFENADAKDQGFARLHYATIFRYLSAIVHGDPIESHRDDSVWGLFHCCVAINLVARDIIHAVKRLPIEPPQITCNNYLKELEKLDQNVENLVVQCKERFGNV